MGATADSGSAVTTSSQSPREAVSSTRPARVLIVGPSHDILGGMSTQAAMLRNSLNREAAVAVSFVVFNPRLPGVLHTLQRIKYLRTALTSAAYLARLLTSVPRQDVVHVFSSSHSSFLIASAPAILVARCARKATILHYHSGQADDHFRRSRRTTGRMMRRVDAIVVPSQYLADQFRRHGFQTQLIPNAIERERFPFRRRRPVQPVFLSNRQLGPLWNVGCVLRAFALVQQRIRAARLIVAADGPDRRALEALAHDLRLQGTDFIGWVSPDRAPELYEAADIFLNGSDYDNLPVSILEAFAAGLPVVSTDAGGVTELVRPRVTGLLVPRGDYHAMASCAMRLLEDPDLSASLARNAYEYSGRFTWPAVREQWLALYATLAVGRPA